MAKNSRPPQFEVYLAETMDRVQAVRTRQRDAVEQAKDLCAEIGTRIWVIRKGVYQGMTGIVLAKWFDGDIWKVKADFDGRIVQLYARSVSRRLEGLDCESAEVQLAAHKVKYLSGQIFD
jgi:hypothetical protein